MADFHTIRRPNVRRHRRRARRGTALIWTALLLFVMILMVGLSIDWGKVTWNVHQLQNATDAAALAGAQWVCSDPVVARDCVLQFASANCVDNIPVEIDRNDENLETGELVLGCWNENDGTFTPTLVRPNAVKVVARRTGDAHGPVGTVFGHLAKVKSIDIVCEAIATALPAGGAGILALADSQTGLEFEGSPGRMVCEGGAVQVNSYDPQACSANGRVGREALICEAVNVCGGTDATFASFTQDGREIIINEGVPEMPDPLAGEPRPGTVDGTPGPEVYWTVLEQGSETLLDPGYYPDGLSFTGNASYTLNPGVYVLGNGLNISGSCSVSALYCQFYIAGGAVSLTGTGDVSIRPPGDNPDNWVDGKPVADGALGVCIWQADDNHADAKLAGTNNADGLQGCMYFPQNRVEVGGTDFAAGEQLIAYQVLIHGTGDMYIKYDGRNPGVVPGRSKLVK